MDSIHLLQKPVAYFQYSIKENCMASYSMPGIIIPSFWRRKLNCREVGGILEVTRLVHSESGSPSQNPQEEQIH